MKNIIEIKNNNDLLAIIVPHAYSTDGITFFTPDSYSQQLACMHHGAGHIIEPHTHNPVPRQVYFTQEVLFIKKGKLRVDFYDDNKNYFQSHILVAGDTILLIKGGHGFEIIEDVDMIEVKQGPYVGEQDKTRFQGANKKDINIIE